MNHTHAEKIRDAIRWAKENGIKLISHAWGVRKTVDEEWKPRWSANSACALGCVLVKDNPPSAGIAEDKAIQKHLGVSDSWTSSFIQGFDDVPIDYLSKHHRDAEAYQLGVDIRNEFLEED